MEINGFKKREVSTLKNREDIKDFDKYINIEDYTYDIGVIGAGHAGCEAAMAGARMGKKTVLFTMSLDTVATLPCNPSIGGTAKGHLVREIDALGGEMGKITDKTSIQTRMLNKGKGPAVHSLRAQVDRSAYHKTMKYHLESVENLYLKQAEITSIGLEDGKTHYLETANGVRYYVKTAIIATGTFLNSKIYVGERYYYSGPDGTTSANYLTDSLREHGIITRRFKTGTPARLHSRSIDFSKLEEQPGDTNPEAFSFETTQVPKNLRSCYIGYTNKKTHEIISDNLHRSPMYGKMVNWVGTRYCPSIEDKVVRFSDKDRHQLFLEPVGLDTSELYLQGASTALPEAVQLAFYRTIEGLENVEIMRNAYGIEYDCCDPTDLWPTLEFKQASGLFGAGQFNGTSGYEEAAAQGLIAGINAALKIDNKEPFILSRMTSYIGTLIDDLVTKGVSDPYRMMTSRSEYRLILRQDNADERLTDFGYNLGLISNKRYQEYLEKMRIIEDEIKRLEDQTLKPSNELNSMLIKKGTTEITTGVKFSSLLRRPQIEYNDLIPFSMAEIPLTTTNAQVVQTKVKYDGYIKRQLEQVERTAKLEEKHLSKEIDYSIIKNLRTEAIEKLSKIRPINLGQASRISGVSPADISVLLIWLASQ